MSVPKILYTDLSVYTFSSLAGTNPDYPLTNLNNYIVNSYWSGSTITNNQLLRFNLSTDTAVTQCVVDGHNFSSFWSGGGYSITLQCADDNNFSSNVTVLGTFSTVTVDDVPISLTFNSVNKRYFALGFSSMGTMNTPPRVGNVFIGTPLEFTTPYDNGFKTENAEYNTSEFVTLSGQTKTSQQYKGRIVYEIKFSLQSTALKTAFQTFIRTIRGKMFPFYFIDDDGTVRYMRLDKDYQPVTSTNAPGFWNIDSLVMKTAEAIY
jgi:hypothetical protein